MAYLPNCTVKSFNSDVLARFPSDAGGEPADGALVVFETRYLTARVRMQTGQCEQIGEQTGRVISSSAQ
jgi:hypothetical protein